MRQAPDWNFLSSFPLTRAVMVGVLILILQVPILLIWGLIGEREARHLEALFEVGEKWGEQQRIAGPVWILPYRKQWEQRAVSGEVLQRSGVFAAVFLPETLDASIELRCDHRYRGIFKIPVFEMDVEMSGEFGRPDPAALGIDASDVLWERAVVSLWISDTHSIREKAILRWNQTEYAFEPGSSEWAASPGIHARLPVHADSARVPFALTLRLNGTEGAFVSPVGGLTRVRMKANWADPSFQGRWLPSIREVTDAGFESVWEIPAIGRNYPQSWSTDSENLEGEVRESAVGVKFLAPVDPYRMAQRSLKYEFLFLLLTFMVVSLIELLGGSRLHWLQYSLIGAALCLFYLLELSLAEHLGFTTAYLLASSGVVALIWVYAYWVLDSFARSLVVGVSVAGLYAYLHILLQNQDYALLIGSLGLFFALGLVMFLTRRIDWSNV